MYNPTGNRKHPDDSSANSDVRMQSTRKKSMTQRMYKTKFSSEYDHLYPVILLEILKNNYSFF